MSGGVLPRVIVWLQWRVPFLRRLGWNHVPPSRFRASVLTHYAATLLDAVAAGRPAAVRHILSPDVYINQTVEAMGALGTYRGPDGFVDLMAEVHQIFDIKAWTPKRVTEIQPGQRILGITNLALVGRGSGVPVTGEIALLVTIESGSITRFESFRDERTALEAAGLSE